MDRTLIETVFRIIFGAGLLFSVGLSFFAWREWRISDRLKKSGATTQAQIVDRRQEAPGNTTDPGRIRYYGRFRFTYQTHTYEVEQRVGRKTYNMLRPGIVVPVRYLPARPTLARLDGLYTDYTKRTALTIPAAMALVIWLILFVMSAPSIL
jgi:hypothetical protein